MNSNSSMTPPPPPPPAPKICEVGGHGLLLPLFGETEANWPDELQATLYLLGLLWCFMGVAIIADVFMGAIEKITSKKVRRHNPKTGRFHTCKVWNDTVANLTLMALGSSAPEILLNVKEVFENGFYAGKLGPMTIVGSAAFNLMCILAVCVSAIPSGDTRAINDLPVYSVTAFFSIFAYVWLYFILAAPPTKDCVTVTEGVLTFLFFPILVTIAWLADIGKLPFTKKPPKGDMVHPENTEEERKDMAEKVKNKYGTDLSEQQVQALIDFEFSQGQSRSRAHYRVNATRTLFRGKALKDENGYHEGKAIAVERMRQSVSSDKLSVVSFAERELVVLESKGPVELKVLRTGNLLNETVIRYHTEDGTAKAESDYEKKDELLTFRKGEREKVFTVAIVNDQDGHEDTEDFFVQLSPLPESPTTTCLGKVDRARVNIVDENHPGKFAFEQEELNIERPKTLMPLQIEVQRRRGFDGQVSIEYVTENESAIAGKDYEAVEGRLDFAHMQRSATITVNILPKLHYEGREAFRVILKDPTGKAMFDETTDGGEESAILTVFLVPLERMATTVIDAFSPNQDQMTEGNRKWKEQFTAAVHCNGDAEAQADATKLDWTIHIIAFPWKVFFACVPPVEYAGGWICFIVALGAIGFVTILIGDLASLLGCAMCVSDFATAITFVALGTSLPDTFASKTAAVQDEHADASIGNVTGSNSVNVFLGLGLPWMVASIYWAVKDLSPDDEWFDRNREYKDMYPQGAFIVPSAGLGLSVGVFSGCSVACLLVMSLRRKFLGAELGGPGWAKWATSILFVILWACYIVVSILNAPS